MKIMKAISVIVPLYYGEKYIDSILYQIEECKTYLDDKNYFEIIFINDSPDVPISKKYDIESINIIIINMEKNIGIHGARLKGLEKCHGDYVLFLDQDDKIKPEYFHSQIKAIGENDAAVCRAIEAKKLYYTGDYIFEKMITNDFIVGKKNPIISPGQVLLKRNSIPDIWTKNIVKNNGADDWFLWLCMIAQGCSMALNQDVLYEHIWENSNASFNLVNMRQSEQEVISIIQRERIFSDEYFGLLLNGFFQMNSERMKELDLIYKHDLLLENWMRLRDRNIDFSLFFKKYNYHTVAIYGAGKLGNHLFYELQNKDIEVSYGIDENSEHVSYPVTVYSPYQQLPNVDVVIITIFEQYEQISNMLNKKMKSTMISIEEMIRTLSMMEQADTDKS